MSIRRIVAVTAAALLLSGAGCSSGDSAPPPPVAGPTAEDDPGARETYSAGNGASTEGTTVPLGEDPGDKAPGSPAEEGGEPHDPPLHQGGGRSGVYDDRDDLDRQGEVPNWIDLTRVTATQEADVIRFRLRVAGVIPDRTQDGETFASIGVRLELSGGDEAHVYLDGNSGGWRASLSRNERTRPLARFSLSGDVAILELPVAAIDSPRRMRWSAYSSWTRSTLLRVYYGFDAAPEGGVIHHRAK